MQLPKDFEQYTSMMMGEDLYADLLKGLDEPSPVSIRLNPFKADGIRTTEITRAARRKKH